MNSIKRKQKDKLGWGAKIIQTLGKDLRNSFPNIKGLSDRNLKYMRKFAKTYPNFELVQQLVALLPWGQNILLLDRFKENKKRIWYAKQTIQNGWSRNILLNQIDSNLHEREAKIEHKTTNFLTVLPAPNSELVQNMIKDPYKLDFLGITEQNKK